MSDAMLLRLAEAGSLADLATFVARAKRVDPDGAARLQCVGAVLAVYVSPVHGAGSPTVLGLRTFALAEPSVLDVVVPLATLTDRFARTTPRDVSTLSVPPAQATGVAWAGVSPPRSGWAELGTVDGLVLANAARDGVAEVAAGAGEASGAPAVARLRAGVWGRSLPGTPDLPAGVAYAADALGFLTGGEPVEVRSSGPWWRASTSRGHVLARQPVVL